MSIAYVAYFLVARLALRITQPRSARDVSPSRYRYDRRAGRWVPVRPAPVRLLSPE